jgi:hypothetical protein
MPSRTAPHQRPTVARGADSRYERAWNTTAIVTAATWIAIAILQTPRFPLFCIAIALGAYGGVLFVRDPVSTRRGRHQYVTAALAVAGLVLVLVGVRQHLLVGLTVFAVLAWSSPSVIRWVAGD